MSMKRIYLLPALFLAVSAALYVSCAKEHAKQTDKATISTKSSDATLQLLPVKKNADGGGSGGGGIVTFTIGHNAGAGCTCPNQKHVPCQGAGSNCTISSSVGIYNGASSVFGSKNNAHASEIYAVELDVISPLTDLPEFYMPARSFAILDEKGSPLGEYLNIPEQILKRNQEGKFEYRHLSYTADPLFENK